MANKLVHWRVFR